MITNRSSRALEWEILKGVMIVDERENIAPGFKQRLSTTLEPGEYAVTCGLLSNPRGKLVVLNAQGGTDTQAAKPSLSELIGLSAEYRVWTAAQLAGLAGTGDPHAIRDILLRLTPLNALAKAQAQALEAALAAVPALSRRRRGPTPRRWARSRCRRWICSAALPRRQTRLRTPPPPMHRPCWRGSRSRPSMSCRL